MYLKTPELIAADEALEAAVKNARTAETICDVIRERVITEALSASAEYKAAAADGRAAREAIAAALRARGDVLRAQRTNR